MPIVFTNQGWQVPHGSNGTVGTEKIDPNGSTEPLEPKVGSTVPKPNSRFHGIGHPWWFWKIWSLKTLVYWWYTAGVYIPPWLQDSIFSPLFSGKQLYLRFRLMTHFGRDWWDFPLAFIRFRKYWVYFIKINFESFDFLRWFWIFWFLKGNHKYANMLRVPLVNECFKIYFTQILRYL